MDLYRHIVHCHVAIKMFLKYYSAYWCLIPMTDEKADFDDYLYEQKMIYYQSNVHLENLSNDDLNSFEIMDNEFRSGAIVNWCINHVPRPPVHYRFSKRQQYEQYQFLKKNRTVLHYLDNLIFINRPLFLHVTYLDTLLLHTYINHLSLLYSTRSLLF